MTIVTTIHGYTHVLQKMLLEAGLIAKWGYAIGLRRKEILDLTIKIATPLQPQFVVAPPPPTTPRSRRQDCWTVNYLLLNPVLKEGFKIIFIQQRC